MTENILVGLVTLAAACVLLSPRVRALSGWRATVTPLASIIGSGFLVSVPLLAREVGIWAIVAMAGLIAASYIVGEAIRFNIAHVEPLLEDEESAGNHSLAVGLERLSHFVHTFPYSGCTIMAWTSVPSSVRAVCPLPVASSIGTTHPLPCRNRRRRITIA